MSEQPSGEDADQQFYDSQDDENQSREEDEIEAIKYDKVLKKIEERKKKLEIEAQINNVVGKSIASILKEKI